MFTPRIAIPGGRLLQPRFVGHGDEPGQHPGATQCPSAYASTAASSAPPHAATPADADGSGYATHSEAAPGNAATTPHTTSSEQHSYPTPTAHPAPGVATPCCLVRHSTLVTARRAHATRTVAQIESNTRAVTVLPVLGDTG